MNRIFLASALVSCASFGFAQRAPKAMPGEAADPAGRVVRENRGRAFNLSAHLASPPLDQMPIDVPGPTITGHRTLLPELPFSTSDTVVIGTISSYQPYLSADRRGVYTELQVEVSDVIKAPASVIPPSKQVTLIETGGSVILDTGRVVSVKFSDGATLLEAGQKYALFLNYSAAGDYFRPQKAWSLKDGKVWATSPDEVGPAATGQTPYGGMAESLFVQILHDSAPR